MRDKKSQNDFQKSKHARKEKKTKESKYKQKQKHANA